MQPTVLGCKLQLRVVHHITRITHGRWHPRLPLCSRLGANCIEGTQTLQTRFVIRMVVPPYGFTLLIWIW